ncbi:MAG TPA: hypothetical protein VF258_08400 [Luteolibacter sp.]
MPSPTLLRIFLRLVILLVFMLAIPLGLLASCQSKLIYFPRSYGPGTTAEWQRNTAGKPIDFITSQGKQRAFLQGELSHPRNLWIVCGGNGTVALDWSEWIAEHAPGEDAYLLVDFPSYGDCEGAPSPSSISESLKACVPLAMREIGWSGVADSSRLRFFGHSLGSAACLIAATEFRIQRGVMIAPFSSTMAMSRHMTGLPLGFLVWHRYDNAARLAELTSRGPGEVVILHGTDDESIPVGMSRTLVAAQKNCVRLEEIPGGRHNTIQETHAEKVSAALRKIGN